MKKFLIASIAFLFILSCSIQKSNVSTATGRDWMALNADLESVLNTAVIYEANIRQYSPEGTFEAFTRDIPFLKNLGVKIIWLMPIHPISMAERKGSLGSYYAVQDYRGINPEFGDLEDFRNLVLTAHANDMYVILDWVANHTGWDHPWITEHPDYYTQNADGEIVDPIDPGTGESWGWTDVADLNYDNAEMREKMIREMLYWVREENVDGFRCDVAHQVPVDFWETAVDRLRGEKPVIMLAEAEQPELLKHAFDMQYAWGGHHLMNEIARGEKTAQDFREYMERSDAQLEVDDIMMYFTSNHDENTWQGTVRERMGPAAEVMAVLTYMIPGMPLIYNGQEYDLDKRLRFFEKDTIPMDQKGEFYTLYEALGELKNTHPALHGGKQAAACHFLPTDQDEALMALVRENGGQRLVFLANLTDETVDFEIDWEEIEPGLANMLQESAWTDYMKGGAAPIGSVRSLGPWAYRVLVD